MKHEVVVLEVLSMIACLPIIFMGIFMAINNMDRCTSHVVRYSWIAITTGAMGVVLGPFYGRTPSDLVEVIIYFGIAGFLMADRRRYFFTDRRARFARGR